MKAVVADDDGAMEVVAAIGGPEAWRGEQHPVCSNIRFIRIFVLFKYSYYSNIRFVQIF